MRVFLDTNVLVSAFVSRGLCSDLLRIVLGEHDGLVSQVVLDELEYVLRSKLGVPKLTLQRALSVVGGFEVLDPPVVAAAHPDLEPADSEILASAVAGLADLLVTGDRELLRTASEISMPAVSPRGFMELARTQGHPYPDRSEGDGDLQVSERAAGTVLEKAFDVAVSTTGLCRSLEKQGVAELARNLFRAGSRVGLELEEAALTGNRQTIAARTKAAAASLRETGYWLRLTVRSGVAPEADITSILETVDELTHLLSNSGE